MFVLDPESLPPNYADQSPLFTSSNRNRLSSAVSIAKDKGVPYELELEVIRADGEHGWMLARGEAVCDSNGTMTETDLISKSIGNCLD